MNMPQATPLSARDAHRMLQDDPRAMLVDIRDRVRTLVDAGKSLEEVQAAQPTAAYDEARTSGFIGPEKMVEMAYRSLSADRR